MDYMPHTWWKREGGREGEEREGGREGGRERGREGERERESRLVKYITHTVANGTVYLSR